METKNISEVCKIISGGTPKTNIPEYWNGEIGWLSVKDFNSGKKYVYSSEKTITELGVEKSSTNILDYDDVIISARGTVGEIAKIGYPMAFNQSCFGLRTKDNNVLSQDYLYYALKNEVRGIKSITQGSVFDTINRASFDLIKIPLFDIETQNKIASILDSIDKKIETNELINRNLSEQALSIYTNLFGNAEKNSTVEEVSINVTDGVHNTVKDDPEGEFYLLSCKNIKGSSLSLGESERRINKETFEKLRKRTKLEKGDILLSSVGTIGELLLLKFNPDNYEFQRSVAIIKPNSAVVSSEYLYCALLSQKQEIIHAGHGAVQQCIFISDIKGFAVHKPEEKLLTQFNNEVSPMMELIHINEEENKRLFLLRDSLLPKLMSGELDVSDLDI